MAAPSRPLSETLTGIAAHVRAARAALPADAHASRDAIDQALALVEIALADTARPGAATAAPSPPATGAPRETLLVVEDNERILALVSTVLSRLGYRVLTAPDGRAALEQYGRSSDDIALLVTDLMMPYMNGSELAREMLKLRPTMRVLFASGYAHEHVFDASLGGPSSFIDKPYTPHSLAQRIRELLDAP
jgi:CheY-like chemotaxis protein